MKKSFLTQALMLLAATSLFAACGGGADKTPTVSDQGKTATTPVEQQNAPDDTKFVAAFATHMKDRGNMNVDVAALTSDFKAAFPNGRPAELNAQMVSWIFQKDKALQAYAAGYVAQAREMKKAMMYSLMPDEARTKSYGMMPRMTMSRIIENMAYLSYGLTYTMVGYLKDFGYDVSVNSDFTSYKDQAKELVAKFKEAKDRFAAEAGTDANKPANSNPVETKKENIEDNIDNIAKILAGSSMVYKDGSSSIDYWYKAIDISDEYSILAIRTRERAGSDINGAGTTVYMPIEVTWEKIDSMKNPMFPVFMIEKAVRNDGEAGATPAGPAPAAKAPAQAAPAGSD